tara:strand:+ start:1001 stop:1333 length:333 start_codon:yes stop_codon:yes gene_type:complete
MRYIRKKDLKAKIERQEDIIFDLKRDIRFNDKGRREKAISLNILSNRITELEHPKEFKKGDKVKLFGSGVRCIVIGSKMFTGCTTYRVYEIITPDGITVYSKGSDLKKTK